MLCWLLSKWLEQENWPSSPRPWVPVSWLLVEGCVLGEPDLHGTTSAFSGGKRPAPGAWPEGTALQAAWPRDPLSTHPSRPYTDPTSALPFALPSSSRLPGAALLALSSIPEGRVGSLASLWLVGDTWPTGQLVSVGTVPPAYVALRMWLPVSELGFPTHLGAVTPRVGRGVDGPRGPESELSPLLLDPGVGRQSCMSVLGIHCFPGSSKLLPGAQKQEGEAAPEGQVTCPGPRSSKSESRSDALWATCLGRGAWYPSAPCSRQSEYLLSQRPPGRE